MKLTNHRRDVAFLKKLGENRLSLKPIAERYQRLYLAYEELEQYRIDHGMTFRTVREQRVLKDVEGK